MGPLAEPTPAVIRNKGAAERKARRRVKTVVTDHRSAQAGAAEGGDSQRRGEGIHRQRQQEEDEDSEEDMDTMMEAVAEAISEAEREATTA